MTFRVDEVTTGEEALASWLKRPAAPEEVRARQDAVTELTPALDLREDGNVEPPQSVAKQGPAGFVGDDRVLIRAGEGGDIAALAEDRRCAGQHHDAAVPQDRSGETFRPPGAASTSRRRRRRR